MLTDRRHLGLLLNTKPLALQDFLGGLILFNFVLITSPHHFRWCEMNVANAWTKKGFLSGMQRTVSFLQAFSFDLLILTPCHTYTPIHT